MRLTITNTNNGLKKTINTDDYSREDIDKIIDFYLFETKNYTVS